MANQKQRIIIGSIIAIAVIGTIVSVVVYFRNLSNDATSGRGRQQGCPGCKTTVQSDIGTGGQITGFDVNGYWNPRCCPISAN